MLAAGFITPLPYNYWRLKALGKSCHWIRRQTDNASDGYHCFSLKTCSLNILLSIKFLAAIILGSS
jgi:hypothetical protein